MPRPRWRSRLARGLRALAAGLDGPAPRGPQEPARRRDVPVVGTVGGPLDLEHAPRDWVERVLAAADGGAYGDPDAGQVGDGAEVDVATPGPGAGPVRRPGGHRHAAPAAAPAGEATADGAVVRPVGRPPGPVDRPARPRLLLGRPATATGPDRPPSPDPASPDPAEPGPRARTRRLVLPSPRVPGPGGASDPTGPVPRRAAAAPTSPSSPGASPDDTAPALPTVTPTLPPTKALHPTVTSTGDVTGSPATWTRPARVPVPAPARVSAPAPRTEPPTPPRARPPVPAPASRHRPAVPAPDPRPARVLSGRETVPPERPLPRAPGPAADPWPALRGAVPPRSPSTRSTEAGWRRSLRLAREQEAV